MISNEKFIELVLNNFTTINQKIDSTNKDFNVKIDQYHNAAMKKIDDLCDRTTRIEDKIQTTEEIKAAVELQTEKTKDIATAKNINDNKKFYVIIALLSTGFSFFTILKEVMHF